MRGDRYQEPRHNLSKTREPEQPMIRMLPRLSRRVKSNVHLVKQKVRCKAFVSMARGVETALHRKSLRIPQ
jgi:hypothetical protein